jgi:hypothetical protein
MLTEFIKKMLRGVGGSKLPKKSEIVNAVSDWRKILIITPILLSAIVAFSLYFFYVIRSDDVFSATGEGSDVLKIVDREMLADTIVYFESKRTELDRLKNEKPSFVDPSL